MNDRIDFSNRLAGLLIGTAVGDAIGLPREGLSPRRAGKMFGGAPLRHRLLFGRGIVSDDTEHAFLTARAMLRCGGDAGRFQKSLGWALRWWFAALPPGVGPATAKACIKMLLGWPAGRAGLFSAGNGPAMRAPIIGAILHDRVDLMRQFAFASARLTHTDPRAGEGAFLTALAAGHAVTRPPDQLDAQEFLAAALPLLEGGELRKHMETVGELLAARAQPGELASRMGLTRGVTGYVNHTVPVAVFCWLRYAGDFRQTVEQTILLGGDADTTGAIAGALAGASVGRAGIPDEWVDGILDWPLSMEKLDRLARHLAASERCASPAGLGLFWPAMLLRNLLCLTVILAHGFRRLLPPF